MKVYVVSSEGNTNNTFEVLSVHRTLESAEAALKSYEDDALEEGDLVEGREDEWGDYEADDADWTITFNITEKELEN